VGRVAGIVATCLLAAYSVAIGPATFVLGPLALAMSLLLVATAPWRLRTRVATAVAVVGIAVLMWVVVFIALRDNLT